MDQEVLLVIRDVTVSGEGVGSYKGLTVFVDGALPGETVRAKIVEKKATYAKAELMETTQIASGRVKPICPVFGRCGGCQIMHMAYEKQLELKKKRVVDAFERIGKLQTFTVENCVASPEPLYYRNKIQLPVSKEGNFGLYAKRSHDIVPIETCYIQSKAGNKILHEMPLIEGIRHILIRSNQKGEVLVVLVTREKPNEKIQALAKIISEKEGVKWVLHGLNARDDNVLFSDAYTTLFQTGDFEEEILGIQVGVSPASFFQVNIKQAENLYQKAFELADLKREARVLDAYSGVGVFSIYLAQKGLDVIGIEVVDSAVEDAKKNALRNGVTVDFRLGTVEKMIGAVGKVDVVFINPPRKGAAESVLAAIVHQKPEKIIYTSCDPATLARDLSFLAKNGYNKVEAFPFDMFPQTMHVETVVRIVKGD